MDRGAWQATVYWVANIWTRLKQLSTKKKNRAPTEIHSLQWAAASKNMFWKNSAPHPLETAGSCLSCLGSDMDRRTFPTNHHLN